LSRTDGEIFPKSNEIIQLGDYRFSLETRELTDANGNTVILRSQSADVLAYLARYTGELVSKEALIENVWADTFVTDDSLVQCIGDIRKALNDAEREIIETLPKKGYRLNADSSQAVAERRRLLAKVLASLATVLVVVGLVWMQFSGRGSDSSIRDRPTIAVLPFDDFSTGEDQGYLSDAIAEGIITELAHFPLISVIARNSSFRYRGSDTGTRQIGKELGVHYLLEGSKQKSGNDLRVTVQLIDAATDTHVWAHSYDQKIGDLFTVQDQIIKTVADRIGVRIERPVPGYDPDKVTALHLHLQGLAIIRKNFNAEAVAQMFELNKKAVEVDPDAPYGYIGLAHIYRMAATFGWLGLERDEALELGFFASDKALEIAPNNPEVHYSRARLFSESGDRDATIANFTRAIELNPSASNYLVASTTPLLYVGKKQEALARLNQAMGIDPFHEDWFHWQMGWALWEFEDCEGALAAMLKMKKIPRGAHRMLAGIYACVGKVEKAKEAYQIYYAEAEEPTISEQREKWKDVWTATGSLERFLEHMWIAGMKE
jgi:TolB-like protein/DNA-binding winged helix-turn-helix (wHTH) protein